MAPADTAARLAAIVALLCELIARHGHLRRIAGPLLLWIWGRVRRAGAEAGAVLARLQSGRLRRHPARRLSRPGTASRRKPAPAPLSRRDTWLVALIQETAVSAAQLRTLLADPDVPALLEAAPQLRRALRPLCHMLGVALPATSPRPRPPEAPPPAASWPEAPRPRPSGCKSIQHSHAARHPHATPAPRSGASPLPRPGATQSARPPPPASSRASLPQRA